MAQMNMKTHKILLAILLSLLALHPATAQVSFAPIVNYTVNHIASVTAADVNGDGKVDLICPNNTSPGSVTILTNNGVGGFVFAAQSSTGNYPVGVAAADLSGKGRLDLITANLFATSPITFDGKTLTVLTNNGGGIFSSNSTYTVGSGAIDVVAADVNGDGKPDLISANYSDGTLTVLTNNGSGRFGFSATYHVGLYPTCVIAVDINGDGALDLVAANGSVGNTLIVLTNNGTGIFSTNATYTVGTGPFGITAADINRDGKPDLISANLGTGSSGTLTVLTNNGSGGFVLSASPRVGNSPYWVTAADINGDGELDLISANSSGTLSVLTNDGSGGFVLASSPNVGGNPFSVLAADVNGDGKLDLITGASGPSAASVSVLFNTTTFPPPISTPAVTINPLGNGVLVSWPSASAGWSLQQNSDLTTSNWSPSGYSGYGFADDGTNKSLIVTPPTGNLFFRLLHP